MISISTQADVDALLERYGGRLPPSRLRFTEIVDVRLGDGREIVASALYVDGLVVWVEGVDERSLWKGPAWEEKGANEELLPVRADSTTVHPTDESQWRSRSEAGAAAD